MNIDLSWDDLVKLASNSKLEKDGITLTISRPVLPDLEIVPDGSKGFVRFTLDETDPRSRQGK